MDPTDEVQKVHEQLLKTSREALREDRVLKDGLEGLVKHPGWKVYLGLLEKMINARGMVILMPAGNADAAIALEFVKGAMNGLILARDLPGLIIDAVPAATLKDDDDE